MGMWDLLGMGSGIIGAFQEQQQWDDFQNRLDRNKWESIGTQDEYRDRSRGEYGSFANNVNNQTAGNQDHLSKLYDQQMGAIPAEYQKAGKDTLATYDQTAPGTLNDLWASNKGILDRYDTDTGATQKGFDDRYSRGMGYIDQMGQQERKDIDRSYKADLGTNAAKMASSGLGSSTIMANMNQGATQRRNQDVGRLDDRLTNMRLGTDAALSGDALGFGERSRGGRAALHTDLSGRETDFRERDTATRTGLADKTNSNSANAWDRFRTGKYGQGLDQANERKNDYSTLGLGSMDLDRDTTNRRLQTIEQQPMVAPQGSPFSQIGAGMSAMGNSQRMAAAMQPSNWWESMLGQGAGSMAGGIGGGMGYGMGRMFY